MGKTAVLTIAVSQVETSVAEPYVTLGGDLEPTIKPLSADVVPINSRSRHADTGRILPKAAVTGVTPVMLDVVQEATLLVPAVMVATPIADVGDRGATIIAAAPNEFVVNVPVETIWNVDDGIP
jgi:hypothetical protein